MQLYEHTGLLTRNVLFEHHNLW